MLTVLLGSIEQQYLINIFAKKALSKALMDNFRNKFEFSVTLGIICNFVLSNKTFLLFNGDQNYCICCTRFYMQKFAFIAFIFN